MTWKLVYAGMELDLQKAQQNPFFEGAIYFLEGQSIDRCPYDIMHLDKARRWKDGWQKASEGKVQLVKEEKELSV